MARTPNYGQQRAERNRTKQARKEEKLKEKEEAAARRKAGLPDLDPNTQPGEEAAVQEAER